MNTALILSGGTGVRMGMNKPKQYIEVDGRPVIAYSMERLFLHEAIDAVQIVADAAWHKVILECIQQLARKNKVDVEHKFAGFAEPGASRQLSVYNGLSRIKDCGGVREDDYVLIHDAARPMLSECQITECLSAVQGHDGVLPVLPMKDTVYSSTDGRRVSSLLNRGEIYAGQAPEVFRFGQYYEANRRLLPDKIMEINGSTEPAILAGMDIVMIPGDENNYKITTREDLDRFEQILRGKGLRQGDIYESVGIAGHRKNCIQGDG